MRRSTHPSLLQRLLPSPIPGFLEHFEYFTTFDLRHSRVLLELYVFCFVFFPIFFFNFPLCWSRILVSLQLESGAQNIRATNTSALSSAPVASSSPSQPKSQAVGPTYFVFVPVYRFRLLARGAGMRPTRRLSATLPTAVAGMVDRMIMCPTCMATESRLLASGMLAKAWVGGIPIANAIRGFFIFSALL